MFVNNEKTLLRIYEALFPHRSVHLVENSKNNTYRTSSYQAINTLSDTNEYGNNVLNDESYRLPSNKGSRNVMMLDNGGSADLKMISHSYESSSRNHNFASHHQYSIDGRANSLEPSSLLPNIRAQGTPADHPYRVSRTNPSLLNQNISF